MNEKHGILQYWQPLLGIITFVAAAGMFYSRVLVMEKNFTDLSNRQDRQFQLYQTVNTEIGKLKEDAAYQKGFIDGLKSKQ